MTTGEAMARLKAATVASVGAIDPDNNFGIYGGAAGIVEQMHAVVECRFVGPTFHVLTADVEFAVYFDGDKIDVGVLSPRRK